MDRSLKLHLEPKTSSVLTGVDNFLTEHCIKSYLVGGFVRDVLLGRETADIDIAVAADALEIAPEVATALGGKYVLLDEVNRVGRVVVFGEGGRWELDFSTFKGSIEQDLERRDFTIDAMTVDFSQLREDFQLIDPFGGYSDLRQGVLRVVSETAFQSDAVRLLRAVRLAAELGFSIDTQTQSIIRRDCQLLTNVAGERVREELLRLLALPQAGHFLAYLDELDLLTVMMPQLAQTKGVVQPKEHFWDVFDHSIKTVVATSFLLRQGTWEEVRDDVLAVTPWSEALVRHFELKVSRGSTRGSMLNLAALLHDIAKPQTKTIESDGRMRFLGHAKEGADVAVNILERLRFSGKEVDLVATMVRHHLRPTQMSSDGLPTRRAIYRYFRDTGEAGIDILFLSLADHLATRGASLELDEWREHAELVEYILSQRFQEESVVMPPKLIDGHTLISTFGLSPGPRIGELLEVVREAQAAGELTTREEALAFVRKQLVTGARR
jgi:poly(A) polymerase